MKGEWYNAGVVLFVGPVGWLLYDGRRPAFFYEHDEVEHVTCESDAEQATPNGSLSG